MAGGREGSADMSIYLSVLRPRSSCWSRPRRISQDPTRSEQNPLLFRFNGRLVLLHTAQICRHPDDAGDANRPFSMQWTARLRLQTRALRGARWTRPSDLITEPAFCRHPPHPLPDGRWLLPIYRCIEDGNAFGSDYSQVLLLESDGQFSGTLASVPDSIGRVHGSIVLSADQCSLLQFFRSRLADRIYCSRGTADGLEWTPPQPTLLPNNNSSIQALRLRSGRLAMIYNRCCVEAEPVSAERWGQSHWPTTRWPLTIALSEDDGLSWPWIRDLDRGEGFCGEANWACNGQLAYPSIVEGVPGELHIAYSWADRLAIRYLCLSEEAILGCTVGP